ncbi:zinc ribbon domain-containing protein [Oceanirhabdus sp. W0125-5]|uniref:zinc ribbon domain-containing protein n=1 Tax=Oceanirhabdus sp. W0125-5 TaxID=2999116 RepID=UPI0022F315CF|nr:zinc ribbon domain-containing protein [Oceanirhabdus sp. W0125-5]WBW96415.1 zinc ribbon domain-containing protein [Oceanirhabdus sp. W0125-5]
MNKIKVCPNCGEENPVFSRICGNCSEELKFVAEIADDMKHKEGFNLKKFYIELSGYPKVIFYFLILFSFIEGWLIMCMVAYIYEGMGFIIILIGILAVCKGIAVAFGYGHAYLAFKRNEINKENIERIFMEMNNKEK